MKTIYLTLIGLLWVVSANAQNHLIVEELELERTDDKSILYKTFAAEVTLAADASRVQTINIETGAGQVILRPSRGSKMIVEAEIVVASKSLSSAYQTLDEHLNLSLSKEGKELFLESIFDYENDGREPFGFFGAPARKVNLVVYVPEKIGIDWNDRSGEIIVDGIKNDLVLRDASGGIKIKDMIGNIELIDHSGEVSLRDINQGTDENYSIDLIDYSGGLTLRNVVSETTIKDTSGGIDVDDLSGDLRIEDTSGEIDVNRVDGSLVIIDTSGSIEVTRLDGSVEVSDTSGGIYINQVSEDVIVRRDGSGGLTVRNVDGEIKGVIRNVD